MVFVGLQPAAMLDLFSICAAEASTVTANSCTLLARFAQVLTPYITTSYTADFTILI